VDELKAHDTSLYISEGRSGLADPDLGIVRELRIRQSVEFARHVPVVAAEFFSPANLRVTELHLLLKFKDDADTASVELDDASEVFVHVDLHRANPGARIVSAGEA